MRNNQYTVSQDKTSRLWYCHMKGFPYIPCFGTFCKAKSDAMEYAKMYNWKQHNVERIERKKREKSTDAVCGI